MSPELEHNHSSEEQCAEAAVEPLEEAQEMEPGPSETLHRLLEDADNDILHAEAWLCRMQNHNVAHAAEAVSSLCRAHLEVAERPRAIAELRHNRELLRAVRKWKENFVCPCTVSLA